MVRAYFATRNASPRDPHDFLNQLVVGEAGDARRLREAGVHERVGDDPGERIQLDDVRDAEPVDADIDPAPVAAAERAIGVERDALSFPYQRFGHAGRRAFKDLERMIAG